MGSATGIGFTKPLVSRVWSVRKQTTVPIFRRYTCFVNPDSEPWGGSSTARKPSRCAGRIGLFGMILLLIRG